MLTKAEAIYTNDRSVRKADGYASHPFSREEIPSLFNSVDNNRAAMKKKLIRPTTLAPAMLLQHKAIEDCTETFAQILRSSPPQDVSVLGPFPKISLVLVIAR